ncbi:MAG: glycosyltransferase family 4 protein [Alicyclobacillus sp.]|nr:glycosyltransferase family 4 protein [Alicyclobacillus sp.]
MPRPKLVYLCLQATREGQASHAHVHEIVSGLARLGWDVRLFEPTYAGGSQDIGILKRLVEFITVQLRCCWALRNSQLLYVRHHFAALPSALIARIIGVPVVQEINGPYEDLFISWPWTRRLAGLFRFLMRTQLKSADATIVVTQQLKEWVQRQNGGKPAYVIPNAANTSLFTPYATCNLAVPTPYVIFFGAFARWQGIDTLIGALREPRWPREVYLVFAGDGAERRKVEELARRHEGAIYLGRIDYDALPGLIAGSLASVVPKSDVSSYSSTGLLPLKLFESMACGVPVIVTDFPGQADLVRKYGCGLVVPPKDPGALAEAVHILYTNAMLRAQMGQRGRIAVENEHSWSARAAETDKVIKALLIQHGTSRD